MLLNLELVLSLTRLVVQRLQSDGVHYWQHTGVVENVLNEC